MKAKISSNTIIRTAVLVVTLINQVLTMLGKNPIPFSENQVYEVLTAVFTVAASLWAWWKNNSFTPAAIKADSYMKEIKQNDGIINQTGEN